MWLGWKISGIAARGFWSRSRRGSDRSPTNDSRPATFATVVKELPFVVDPGAIAILTPTHLSKKEKNIVFLPFFATIIVDNAFGEERFAIKSNRDPRAFGKIIIGEWLKIARLFEQKAPERVCDSSFQRVIWTLLVET
jgi:hypothetical protein